MAAVRQAQARSGRDRIACGRAAVERQPADSRGGPGTARRCRRADAGRAHTDAVRGGAEHLRCAGMRPLPARGPRGAARVPVREPARRLSAALQSLCRQPLAAAVHTRRGWAEGWVEATTGPGSPSC